MQYKQVIAIVAIIAAGSFFYFVMHGLETKIYNNNNNSMSFLKIFDDIN